MRHERGGRAFAQGPTDAASAAALQCAEQGLRGLHIGCLLVDYYTAHGTPNERMLTHYIKGCAYRDMGDQPAALRCYNDAVAAADTSMADCDYEQLSIIYGQIARIFNNRAMSDNAL